MGVIASRYSSELRERDGRKANGQATRESSGSGTLPEQRQQQSPVTDLLERLTRIQPSHHRVVTCYLKLEPRDRSRGKYQIKLKNRIKAAVQGLPRLGLPRQESDAVLRDLDRIQQFLRSPSNLPSSQGVAVFACEGIDLFETVALPVVYRSRLAVDPTPLVRELTAVEDEFGRLLTVVLDRASARFFEVTAYATSELSGLRADSTRGKRFHADQDGSG